jgi:hypothetical protein
MDRICIHWDRELDIGGDPFCACMCSLPEHLVSCKDCHFLSRPPCKSLAFVEQEMKLQFSGRPCTGVYDQVCAVAL